MKLDAYASITARNMQRCALMRCRRPILPGERMLLVRAVGWCCPRCAALPADVDVDLDGDPAGASSLWAAAVRGAGS